MIDLFVNSAKLTHFEIKSQIRRLTDSYKNDLLVNLNREFNSFAIWELVKINSQSTKVDESEMISEYIEEEGAIVDFFPEDKFEVVQGIIKHSGTKKIRMNNLNFDDYQNLLNSTFDFKYCFNEIVRDINKTNIVSMNEEFKNNTNVSVISFFKYVNENFTPELEILKFIEKETNNDLNKLEVLKKDLENFEINFITNEIVESWFNEIAHNPKSISKLFTRFKEIVINKIEECRTKADQHSETINQYDETIFKNYFAFELFEKMKGLYSGTRTPQADYSFLFDIMQKEDFVICTGVKFIEFLSDFDISITKIDSSKTGNKRKTILYKSTKENLLEKHGKSTV